MLVVREQGAGDLIIERSFGESWGRYHTREESVIMDSTPEITDKPVISGGSRPVQHRVIDVDPDGQALLISSVTTMDPNHEGIKNVKSVAVRQ